MSFLHFVAGKPVAAPQVDGLSALVRRTEILDTRERSSTIVQFPGGYLAEIHSAVLSAMR